MISGTRTRKLIKKNPDLTHESPTRLVVVKLKTVIPFSDNNLVSDTECTDIPHSEIRIVEFCVVSARTVASFLS